MPRSVLVPITNVYAKGDYTAEVKVGSEKRTANLILDTGSSTLVVQNEDYNPADDDHLQPTEYAQDIIYGMGGWYGPVVKTHVHLGMGIFKAGLPDVHIAVTKKEQTGCFAKADGLLGLAYHELNKAYDLSDYLQENGVDPAHTYPWHLEAEQQDDNVREFRSFLRNYPSTDIVPYFTQLEKEGVVGNQFAFIIQRSSVYQTTRKRTTEELRKHPLNNGVFVLGEPKIHTHLFEGRFKEVKVLDDKYYNVNMISMQVGAQKPVPAPKLEKENVSSYVSNAIVDSGAAGIMFPKALFDGLFEGFIAHNPKFEDILKPYKTFEGKEVGIDINLVDFEEWPPIHLTFEGFDGETETLTMTPDTYWQTHAPEPNQVSFQFVNLPKWPNQSVLGLPFMNNFFTLFDRAERENGAVMFAEKKLKFNKLADNIHDDIDKVKSIVEKYWPFK